MLLLDARNQLLLRGLHALQLLLLLGVAISQVERPTLVAVHDREAFVKVVIAVDILSLSHCLLRILVVFRENWVLWL